MFALFFFFFNDPATTEIYTLSLHDALPIFEGLLGADLVGFQLPAAASNFVQLARRLHDLPARSNVIEYEGRQIAARADRKSTRLNSSHANISYAVFCLKKKKTKQFKSSI